MTAQEARVRPYHHGDLRRALVTAATELAATGGAENVTLREVARRVGVSASAAYRHFPNREGLLAQVASEAREALARRMIAAAEAAGARAEGVEGSKGAPVDRFRATGRAYIEFALDEPGLFEVAFRACPPNLYVPDDPSPYAVLTEKLDALSEAGLLAVARQGAEVAAWVAVHGAAVLLGDGMLPKAERDAIVDATLQMVGGGLLVATAHA